MKMFELDDDVIIESDLVKEFEGDISLLYWVENCQVGDTFYEMLPHNLLIRIE